MNFNIINREMSLIRKRNNTKVVAAVGKIFENLEKIPKAMQTRKIEEKGINDQIQLVDRRMASMKLSVEGFLRRAATIKIFCGLPPAEGVRQPDLSLESEGTENRKIHVTGTYSHKTGFEFIQ